MLNKIISLFFILSLSIAGISGCITSTPQKDSSTTKESASISFKFAEPAAKTPIQVYIDGNHMGNAQDFQTSKARLEIVTGTHILELKSNNQTLQKEKFFVSKGSNKEFLIN